MQQSKVWCWKPNIYELFFGFWAHLGCLVLETHHLRIIFGILDPYLGCLVLETLHLRVVSEVWDPDLGCFVLETQHLRIVFEFWAPDLGCLVLETHFPIKCSKHIDFFMVWEPARYTKADPADPDKMSHRGQLWP